MESWTAHHLFEETRKRLGASAAEKILKYTVNLKSKKLPVIFSLNHLSRITNIDYYILRRIVNRDLERRHYKLFSIKKRSKGLRYIHAVNGKLFYLQKFINSEILQKIEPHHSSFAFHPKGGIKACASLHCGSRWLFQFDLKDFFFSISERRVYKVFLDLGYKSLLAFELARLCTTLYLPRIKKKYLKRNFRYKAAEDMEYLDEYIVEEREESCQTKSKNELEMLNNSECAKDEELIDNETFLGYSDDDEITVEDKKFPYFNQRFMGVLPQGAPSSPMLSNLVAYKLDEELFSFAQRNGFVYTRYADDITFSTSRSINRNSIAHLKWKIISLIRKNGFKENNRKIRIAGPGSKKIVLGLLVDGGVPRISRELYKRIDSNLYSIRKFGLEKASEHYKFDSAFGFLNHVLGLMSYINDVSPNQWKEIVNNHGHPKDIYEKFLAQILHNTSNEVNNIEPLTENYVNNTSYSESNGGIVF